MTDPTIHDLQGQTLAAYGMLVAQQADWAGMLLLIAADPSAVPIALAASIARAAVLWIDPSPASLREMGQQGTLDFSVTTLSEAVRILKNQVRKGEPVIVGLADAAGTAWPEAVHRGLQPDAVCAPSSVELETLVSRGALRLSGPPQQTCRIDPAPSWRERRAGDQRLLDAAKTLPPEQQQVAARWYAGAARLFPHDLHRCVASHWPASDTTA